MKTLAVGCSILALLFSNCKGIGKDAANEIGEKVVTASENVEQASKNIEEGLTKLSQLDPIALNKLLNENEDLRQKLQEQQQRLLNYSGAAVELQLEDRKLYFVPNYVAGDFDVRAILDTPENLILDTALRSGDHAFSPDYMVFYREWCPQHYGRCSPNHTAGNLIGAIDAYHAWMMNKFKNFERGQSQMLRPIYLDESLFGYGSRYLKIQVTPRAPAVHGGLVFRASLTTKSPDGTEDVVRTFDWDTVKDSLEVGKPVEHVMLVRVARPQSATNGKL